MPQHEESAMMKEGHILYDSTSTNETTQIHKSKETVLARNQNVVTGEQFKYFSYLLIYYL